MKNFCYFLLGLVFFQINQGGDALTHIFHVGQKVDTFRWVLF